MIGNREVSGSMVVAVGSRYFEGPHFGSHATVDAGIEAGGVGEDDYEVGAPGELLPVVVAADEDGAEAKRR